MTESELTTLKEIAERFAELHNKISASIYEYECKCDDTDDVGLKEIYGNTISALRARRSEVFNGIVNLERRCGANIDIKYTDGNIEIISVTELISEREAV